MSLSRSRPGYIFLLAVFFTGAIALAAVSSLLLLSWASEQSGVTFVQSSQALGLANTCAEYALRGLRRDPFYGGGDTLIFDQRGSCDILPIRRDGNTYVICTEGESGQTLRRLHVRVRTLFPNPIIESYRESMHSIDCLP